MNPKYLINMNQDCTDNYEIVKAQKELIFLKRTNDLGDIYSKKGLEGGIVLFDDGDKIILGLDGRKIELDYAEVSELFTLLKLKKDLDPGLLQGELMEVRRKIK